MFWGKKKKKTKQAKLIFRLIDTAYAVIWGLEITRIPGKDAFAVRAGLMASLPATPLSFSVIWLPLEDSLSFSTVEDNCFHYLPWPLSVHWGTEEESSNTSNTVGRT